MPQESDVPKPDLTLQSGGFAVWYMDTSTSETVSYELFGMQLTGDCPDCGSGNTRDKGSFDKCMDCGLRITMEYLENKIITSG